MANAFPHLLCNFFLVSYYYPKASKPLLKITESFHLHITTESRTYAFFNFLPSIAGGHYKHVFFVEIVSVIFFSLFSTLSNLGKKTIRGKRGRAYAGLEHFERARFTKY